ncbi:hypothetical protein [Geobacter sp. SVR]|uniref:hypothetical protein n=1 Tax=Geobacter sp. SVR TaxID=2495594 RepID=UPI00143EFDA8|nr:hypothetical protein [Geobacter sp. SVR]BCS56087.1 hypothetical protein GSVR_43950 [Geobacter sp. SVR]GCF84850.1 hypothetical protein GSbR_14500 [Geobacter sp. SVR]
MKKLISLALVLALAAAFTAGCKKKEEAPVATPAPAVEAPKPVQAPMSAKPGAAPAEAPKAPEAPKK